MTSNSNPAQKRRRRSVPLLWISGGAAAALVVLGVNGTLSSWSTAIIGNPNNSVAAATSVALSETGGAGTDTSSCDTATDTTGANTATCSTINKYGGVAGGGAELGTNATAPNNVVPLSPGGSRTATVTLKNDGTGTGDLTLTAGLCSSAVNDSAQGYNSSVDICTQITVGVVCGTTTVVAPTPLSALAGPYTVKTGLAPATSVNCTFTVKLPTNTASAYSNQLASQALTWTLTAA